MVIPLSVIVWGRTPMTSGSLATTSISVITSDSEFLCCRAFPELGGGSNFYICQSAKRGLKYGLKHGLKTT
ncbi:hypothetical protein GCM10027217_35100 [Pseudomaricurvus hydrocarbonicus]